MDVEAAHAARGKTRFDKLLAVLVGMIALLATLLATLQQDSSRREERALILAARLSVGIFEGTAGSSPYDAFRLNALREASSRSVEAAALATAALGRGGEAGPALALAQARLAADPRIFRLAREMGRPPTTEDGVHPHTAAVATTSVERLTGILGEQGQQVDAADRFGKRGNLAVLGLSLLAIAAALVALAGVSGRGTVGWVSAVAAAALLAASTGWGVTALLV
jgi:hypothetical protein